MRKTSSISGSMVCQLSPQPSLNARNHFPQETTSTRSVSHPARRQIIGFNLAPKFQSEDGGRGQFIHASTTRNRILHDPAATPRSALQTLLAATRETGVGEETMCSVPKENVVGFLSQYEKGTWKSDGADTQGICFAGSKQRRWIIDQVTGSRGCAVKLCREPLNPCSLKSYSHCYEVENSMLPNNRQPNTSPEFFCDTSCSNFTALQSIHFLDACYLCKRPLEEGVDIFMYRGDKAFCSMDCRYQKILIDEQHRPLRSGILSADPTI